MQQTQRFGYAIQSASMVRYLWLPSFFLDELAMMVQNKVGSNVTATYCINVRTQEHYS
jgi:hypothetical protein